MKIYQGVRRESGAVVTVSDGGNCSELNPRFDLRNHSPTGFEWGYGGSGPAQLALAILADHLQDVTAAQKLYQDFKFKVIGSLIADSWTLSSADVEKALAEIKGERHQSAKHL